MTRKDRLAAVPVLGTLMAVQKRTKADAADQFGAAIAFHGFISLFPLVAVAVAIAGWLLADQPEQVEAIVDAIQQAIPGLETDAVDGIMNGIIDNAGSIGLIGFIGALYTGLRVTTAAQTSTQFVFGVALEKVSFLKARAQQLGSLFVLGLLAIAGVAVSAWVQSVILSELDGPLSGLVPTGALLLSAFLDVLLFWTAYRLYSTGAGVGWQALVPGALVGGVGWAALKYFGGAYLARQADSSVVTGDDGGSAAAVVLASMIGLLLLFYLAGRLYVYGAELSAVMAGVGDRTQREHTTTTHDETGQHEPVPTTEHASGNQHGLLAALTAHEQRRGVTSPDDTDSLFPVGSEQPGASDAGAAEAEPGASDAGTAKAPDRVVASAGSMAAGTATDTPAAQPPAGLAGKRAGDDVRVTIGHEPGGAGAWDESDDGHGSHDLDGPGGSSDPAGPDASGRRDGPAALRGAATAMPAVASTSNPPMTRELVPFAQSDGGGMASLLEDPATRRIAIAAAVGLVGLAAGAVGWRRRG